jgi:hypothetical protein
MRKHLSYANVTATLALIVAVAGGTTAVAVTVNASKKSDVNKKGNIRAGKVTAKKLADGSVVASKLAPTEVVSVQSGFPVSTATCPAGTRLIGGGGTAGLGERLFSSTPNGNGWRAESPGTPIAYALCLKTPGG